VLQYHFNWKTLSAIAGVPCWNFYFRMFPGAIRSPAAHPVPGAPAVPHSWQAAIVWDGLPGGHRSRAVWQFVQQQRGRLRLEYLPGYAPELNPERIT